MKITIARRCCIGSSFNDSDCLLPLLKITITRVPNNSIKRLYNWRPAYAAGDFDF